MDTNGPNRNSVFKKVATPWNDDSVNDVKLHYARTQGEVNAGNEFYRGNLPAATSSAERMFPFLGNMNHDAEFVARLDSSRRGATVCA